MKRALSTRRQTPGVKSGSVQKKNSWTQSTDYYYAPAPREVQLDRKRPGEGYLHVLNKHDLYTFLELLPDWRELAVGLNAIVLAPGEFDVAGYHLPGVVHVCAWTAGLWEDYTEDFYNDHAAIFERLGVPCEPLPDGGYLCKFDEAAVHGYQLLHILLHELGHHHDRMTTRSQKRAGRGETYAENYALEHADAIWDSYLRAFRR
jgi:hypothetical protein